LRHRRDRFEVSQNPEWSQTLDLARLTVPEDGTEERRGRRETAASESGTPISPTLSPAPTTISYARRRCGRWSARRASWPASLATTAFKSIEPQSINRSQPAGAKHAARCASTTSAAQRSQPADAHVRRAVPRTTCHGASEQLSFNQRVVGSIPTALTNKIKGLA
jgi:hypothetical protein